MLSSGAPAATTANVFYLAAAPQAPDQHLFNSNTHQGLF